MEAGQGLAHARQLGCALDAGGHAIIDAGRDPRTRRGTRRAQPTRRHPRNVGIPRDDRRRGFPCHALDLDPEDEAIGRRYRTLLESKHGIRFAPEQIAEAFSFETTYPKGRPFGFHGLFNMWLVLPQQELVEFVSVLAPSSVAGRQFLQLGKNYLELGRKEEAISVWTDAVEQNPRLALINNQLAGAKRSLGRFEEATAHEKQADQSTPDDPLYHWMIALRLKNLGMTELAEKHFQRAIQLNPRLQQQPR